jgi:colanic acid biosynthesis glycosyl transferase WcaI
MECLPAQAFSLTKVNSEKSHGLYIGITPGADGFAVLISCAEMRPLCSIDMSESLTFDRRLLAHAENLALISDSRLIVTILFLNQYFPPDPAPTGILLKQIGETMRSAGHQVGYVSAGQRYGQKTLGGRRLLRELTGLWRIFQKGLAAPRPDIVFSASSPPCLIAVATLIARRHGAQSVHWAMDLYPELAAALGEIPPVAARFVSTIAGRAYRSAALVVALDSDMVERLRTYSIDCPTMLPWVLDNSLLRKTNLTHQPQATPPIWIYSGNLGRAHEWKTLLDTQALLEKRGSAAVLVFQGSGPGREPAEKYARQLGLKKCEWRDYLPMDRLLPSLLAARVLIATQRPETRGMLWPSKLALLEELPRPILWVGPTDGAVARALRQRSGSGIFPPGSTNAIADWLEKAFSDATRLFPAVTKAKEHDAGRKWWKNVLERLSNQNAWN